MFKQISTAFKEYSILSKELKSNRTQLKKDSKLCADAKATNKKISDLGTQSMIRTHYKTGVSLVDRAKQYHLNFPWLSKVVAALNFIIGNRLLVDKTKKRIERLEEKSKGLIDLKMEPTDKTAQKAAASETRKTEKAPLDDMELSEEQLKFDATHGTNLEETPPSEKRTSNLFDSVNKYDLRKLKEAAAKSKEIKIAQEEEIKMQLDTITDEASETKKYLEEIKIETKYLSMEERTLKIDNFNKNIKAIQEYLKLPEEQQTANLFPEKKQRAVAKRLLLDHEEFMQATGLKGIIA